MGLIGTLAVNVVARTEKFTRDITKSRKGIAKFSADAKKATSVVRGFIGAFTAGVGIYGVTRSLQDAAARMDKLAKVSDKLGIASERLAGIQHAANQTGVATNTLNMALQRMTRRVAEAAAGTGEAVKALKELGIDAQELNKLSPDMMFNRIAGAMAKVEGQSNKVRLAFKLFDSEGVDLVNTLSLGSDGLNRMQKEAEQLGIAISREKLAEIEKFNDEMKKLGDAFKGISNKILIDIAPAATEAITTLSEALSWAREMKAGKAKKDGLTARQRAQEGFGGKVFGRWVAGKIYDFASGDAALRRQGLPVASIGPANPRWEADNIKRARAGRNITPQAKSALDYINSKIRAVPGQAKSGTGMLGQGLGIASNMLGSGIRGGAGGLSSMAGSAIAAGQRNASIRELEERLEGMGAGNQSRRNLPLNAAIRKGSAEAEVAIARQKQQAEEVKRDKEKVESLKAIREEMQDMNEQFKAGTIPVFSMEAVA